MSWCKLFNHLGLKRGFPAGNLLLILPVDVVMKKHVNRCFGGIIAALSLAALPAAADLEVTASVQIHARADFEAPLAPHGTWVEFGSYGRCWRPARVEVGWRPYCHGEWVWTDCGWYWASDEPWAWACYHYGSWVYDPVIGWVWVPQVEWAPAWVSWRVGGGYVGWAPLPPPGLVFAARPSPSVFVFVGTEKFGDPVRPSSIIVKNTTIFNKTAEIGGIKRESVNFTGTGSQKVMVNHGPGIEMVQKATGRNFTTVSIHEAVRRTAGPGQSKHAITGPRVGKDKHGDGESDHGSDRADAHGKDNFNSSPDRPWNSGTDSGHGNGGGDKGHQGGHDRH